jgi:LmbE family N-acetylglucosaminyl deacetylase
MMVDRNVLAVGAHADDIEIGCGGVVAKHVKSGDNVIMLVMTTSDYTNYDGRVLRTLTEAEIEMKKGAEALGAKLIRLNFASKKLPYSNESVELINEIIDKHNIDIVYTHWYHDTHQDHIRTTQAVMSAGRYVPTILMYEPEYPAGRSYLGFRNQCYVDITDTFEQKMKAIMQHETQTKKYEKKGFLEAVEARCRHRGYQIGKKYAECFEVIRIVSNI